MMSAIICYVHMAVCLRHVACQLHSSLYIRCAGWAQRQLLSVCQLSSLKVRDGADYHTSPACLIAARPVFVHRIE